MFSTLRVKLIASYALVILLSLVLAGSAFAVLMRNNQTQKQLNELADYAVPIAFQVRNLERSGQSTGDIGKYLQARASELNVRIFLLDENRHILVDTDGILVGQSLPSPFRERPRMALQIEWGEFAVPNGDHMTFASIDTATLREALQPGRPRPEVGPGQTPLPDFEIVVAVPQERVTEAWLQLAPSLIVAAMIALIVSTLVAFFLARSITRPLMQVARASEHMARGDFDQFIEVKSGDEVGHLAASFNAMAREVGRMHRAMRDLLANVSHELRTPLTSIEGFAQAMADGTIRTPEQFRDAGLIIGEEADRMSRLVTDLLYLSKIEAGQVPLERSPVNLEDLLQSCARAVQPPTGGNGPTVEVEESNLPPIVADRHRLQQVFVNLLSNAAKHTPPDGTIDVRAYTVPAPVAAGGASANGRANGLMNGPMNVPMNVPMNGKANGAWVGVDVHNSGSYIPPSHLDRIFERFYQVDGSRSGPKDGSGLGLAIVQEIVQAHHGRIEVRSDPEHGTTFTVYLPVGIG